MNFDRLTEFLEHTIPTRWGVPGCDCIVYHHHRPVYRHTAGFADREAGTRLRSDAFYHLYSASKVITCATALTLLDDGHYLLEDPLYAYIPEFRDMTIRREVEPGKFEIEKAKNPITIRDLFTMSSGMDYNLRAPGIVEVVERTNGRAPTLEVVRGMAKEPLRFEPGTHFWYSLSHDVLGGLIEVLSGKPFGTYMRERIFDPLGMEHTGFSISPYMQERMPTQYHYYADINNCKVVHQGNNYKLGTEYESGGAGLCSSVSEYILFAEALCNHGVGLNGERILSSGAIDMMRANTLPKERHAEEFARAGYGYGLGVRTLTDRAEGSSPSSIGEFGWDGAAGCYVLVDPEQEVSIFYAQAALGSPFTYYHRLLRNIVYASLER